MATAQQLATMFDQSMNILCSWATGDNTAFEAWLNQYAADGPAEYEFAHERQKAFAERHGIQWGVDRPSVSELGGGSEAVYWHDTDHGVIGIATTGLYYVVPLDAEPPEIIDYEYDGEAE